MGFVAHEGFELAERGDEHVGVRIRGGVGVAEVRSRESLEERLTTDVRAEGAVIHAGVVGDGLQERLGRVPIAAEHERAEEGELLAEALDALAATPAIKMRGVRGQGRRIRGPGGGGTARLGVASVTLKTLTGHAPGLGLECDEGVRQSRVLEKVEEHGHHVIPPVRRELGERHGGRRGPEGVRVDRAARGADEHSHRRAFEWPSSDSTSARHDTRGCLSGENPVARHAPTQPPR